MSQITAAVYCADGVGGCALVDDACIGPFNNNLNCALGRSVQVVAAEYVGGLTAIYRYRYRSVYVRYNIAGGAVYAVQLTKTATVDGAVYGTLVQCY